MGLWSLLFVGLTYGLPVEGVDCDAFDRVIEAQLKNVAMAKAETIGDDSAPRHTNAELEIANNLHLIGINIDLMKAAGCPLRIAPITGNEYLRFATECQKARRQPFGRGPTDRLPECDLTTWQRVRIGSAALRQPANPTPHPPASTPVPAGPRAVTLAMFEEISEGMAYTQVVALVGAQGAGPVSTTDGNTTSEVYTWIDSASAGKMKVAFQNSKVVWKTQFKLD